MKETTALVLWLAVIWAIVAARCVDRAEAEPLDTRGQDMRAATVLARVCFKEAGIHPTDDCAAIRVVLERVGRGDVVRGARLYSKRTFLPERLGRRPWIAFLNGAGTEPQGWPENLSWRAHRPRWLELVEHARTVLASPPVTCGGIHWGDRFRDHERAMRMHWVLVDCGDTRNEFWRVPERRRR